MNIKRSEVIGPLIGRLINDMFHDGLFEVYSSYKRTTGVLTVHSVVSLGRLATGSTEDDAVYYAKRNLVRVLDFLTQSCNSVDDERIAKWIPTAETKEFFPTNAYGATLTLTFED